jgi:trehalose-6-phosphate hydrolase
MTNPKFERINDYRDVESLNIYKLKRAEGMSEEEILDILKQKSRDNSRTPVQWDDSENAGFTSGTPWIETARNYKEVNAQQALRDKNSILYHYQKLNKLRKEYDIITDGDYQSLLEEDDTIFAYMRSVDKEKLLVINNFYGKETTFILPETVNIDGYTSEILVSNYHDSSENMKYIQLRPYESIVYYLKQ